MRQIFSSGSSGETCALARAAAAAAAARAAAASASGFCANAAGPKRLAATRQLAVSIQIFLISSSLGPCRAPLDFFHCGQSIALVPAMEILPDHGSARPLAARITGYPTVHRYGRGLNDRYLLGLFGFTIVGAERLL